MNKNKNMQHLELSRQVSSLFPFDLVGPELQEVEELITKQFISAAAHLAPAASLVTHGGGKRLRPAVFLLFLRISNKSPALNHSKLPHTVIATVLELCHTASLIHDDVIDRSEIRRGLPALHAMRGNREAVLYGDHILAQAFQLLSDLARPELVSILSDLVAEVCSGEIRQWSLKGLNLKEDDYLDIIKSKTASFFRVAATLAGRISHMDNIQASKLENFGESFGIAYQVYDDLYDILSPLKPDKSTGRDVESGILTLPWIKLRENCGIQTLQQLYFKAKTAKPGRKEDEFYRDNRMKKAILQTVFFAEKLIEAGKTSLKIFPQSSTREALLLFCSQLRGKIQELCSMVTKS